MAPSDRLATAAHLHVLMRRKIGRVTDTEWMAGNLEYAQAMIDLCMDATDPELHDWAQRLSGMWANAMTARRPAAPSRPVAPARPAAPEPAAAVPAELAATVSQLAQEAERLRAVEARYIGRLR